MAVESVLRPGYSQINNNVSDLGLGPYSIIQNANFIIFGTLIFVFALGLREVIPRGTKSSDIAPWIVIIFGIGIIFAGITLLFAGSAMNSSAVDSHTLASFVAFFAAIGMQLLVWRALRVGDGAIWGMYRAFSLVSGFTSLAMLIVFSYYSNMQWHGLAERFFIAAPWTWVEVSALKIRSIAKSQTKA